MSDSDSRSVPGRVAAYEAAISYAVQKADSDSYFSRFTTSDIADRVNEDVSERTVRRALKDAKSAGWVTKFDGAKKWKPGDRAEQFSHNRPSSLTEPDADDVDISDRPLDGKTVVLVGCGDSKRSGKHAAKHLYDSNYFSLKRQYAEAVADVWYVISAEYGLVPPNQVIETYDTHISDVDIQDWEEDVSDDLPDLQGATVEVLAGETYADALDMTLELWAESVEYPTSGMSIGNRMKWLKENTPDI